MQKTIFIVDDTISNLYATKAVLEKHYSVLAIPSAEKLLLALSKRAPDLILLDLEMPEADGFETIRLLKANKMYSDIPVIFYSSLADSETETKSLELGAFDYIVKPCSTPLLLERIKKCLTIQELIRDPSEPRIRSKNAETFVNGTQRNIDRIKDVLVKDAPYDEADLLMYTINMDAIINALISMGEWELSLFAAKLQKAGQEKNTTMILERTPEFLDGLLAVSNEVVQNVLTEQTKF